jgi:hypothetical protein
MTELARIRLAGGGAILFESDEVTDDGPVKAGRVGDRVRDAAASLQELIGPVTETAEVLLGHLSRAKPAELEVEFGVSLSAGAGAVITKTALSGNIKVKMKWRQDGLAEPAAPEEPATTDQP